MSQQILKKMCVLASKSENTDKYTKNNVQFVNVSFLHVWHNYHIPRFIRMKWDSTISHHGRTRRKFPKGRISFSTWTGSRSLSGHALCFQQLSTSSTSTLEETRNRWHFVTSCNAFCLIKILMMGQKSISRSGRAELVFESCSKAEEFEQQNAGCSFFN